MKLSQMRQKKKLDTKMVQRRASLSASKHDTLERKRSLRAESEQELRNLGGYLVIAPFQRQLSIFGCAGFGIRERAKVN